MFGRSGLFYPHGEIRCKENAKNELLILYSNQRENETSRSKDIVRKIYILSVMMDNGRCGLWVMEMMV